MSERVCKTCAGEPKPIELFTVNVKGKPRVLNNCKSCRYLQTRKWKIAHRDTVKALNKKSYAKNGHKYKTYQREYKRKIRGYYDRHPEEKPT